MFRKLILASAVTLTLLPTAGMALSLGGISAQSALNEPFAGQIELLEINPDQIDEVKVSLAPVEEFEKVGAPRPNFLTGLSFNPEVSSAGGGVIRVTSLEPIREPYLDFLIEVESAAGRVVKEYTVLLDPPVTVASPPPRVEQPAIASPVATPAPSAAPALPQEPELAAADSTAFPVRYGPVEPGAGLWRIARKMAAETGASVSQTAMALYRSNQKAFIRGDVNRLKVGVVLEIPSSAELYSLDTGAAKREFKAALRGESVTSTPLAEIAPSAPRDQLKIAGTAVQAAPSQVPSPESTATADFGAGMGVEADTKQNNQSGAPSQSTIEQDLLLVQESGESNRQQTEELRNRVHELEAQLADIQRLLTLSNERFAQLQGAALEPPDGATEQAVGVEASPQAEKPSRESPSDASALAETPDPVVRPSFWDSIPQPMLAVAAAVPLLLGLLGWVVYKRRKSLGESSKQAELTSDEDAIAADVAMQSEPLAEHPPASTDVPVATHSPYGAIGSLEEEPEDAGIVSEADVYIAYGRYREAESLLEDELARSPDRLDVKYKLAEAYYGAGDLPAMEGIMSAMKQDGGHQGNVDQWQRLEEMLRDLKGNDAQDLPSIAGANGDRDGYSVDLDMDLEIEDLDVISGDLQASESEGPRDEVSSASSELELKLEDLDSLRDVDLSSFASEEVSVESASQRTHETAAEEPPDDSLDIAPVGKDSLASDALSSQWQMESGMWDEVATKIDLARAYMEMEDPEAARVILEEVTQEGNEEQRAEAKEMMGRLA